MSVWRVREGIGRFPHWFKEGGTWGKHGFPHGSEPKASDAHFSSSRWRFVSSTIFWAICAGTSS
jgi:hypothetical protein